MARKKSQPSWWIAFVLLILGSFSLLGKLQLDPQEGLDPGLGQGVPSASPTPGGSPLPPSSNPDTIRIASFNIQVFGQSKLNDRPVIERLAEVVRQFELVAIQEIRSADQNLMPEFVKIINSRGPEYQFLISPRLGRTVSKEQYAYVYRTNALEPIPGSVFNVQDPQDLIHREPFVAGFRTRTRAGQPFSFTLINAHTSPDDAEEEVAELAEVFKFVTQHHRLEDDIILLGDLNVANNKLGPFTRIPQIVSIVPEGPTNTRKTRQYDHILVNLLKTKEFTGRAGVLDLEAMFQISQAEALKLSDHLPVWAEFSAIELPPPAHLASPVGNSVTR